MKIDCNNTQSFFKEFTRMCNTYPDDCGDCIAKKLAGDDEACGTLMQNNPLRLQKAVQDWSNAHPIKTRLDALIEAFPSTKYDGEKEPAACAKTLGLCSEDECKHYASCVDCWEQPYKEQEE